MPANSHDSAGSADDNGNGGDGDFPPLGPEVDAYSSPLVSNVTSIRLYPIPIGPIPVESPLVSNVT
ncbi:MAG TPA: hypothetical protein VL485_12830 [Ktedonobacteraceae bacterium]|nr:hypothetical protein [Ktedonobacteraceae bacterium]